METIQDKRTKKKKEETEQKRTEGKRRIEENIEEKRSRDGFDLPKKMKTI